MSAKALALSLLIWLGVPSFAAGGPSPSLPGPLTDVPGDPARGLEIFRDGSKATCLICHSVSTLPDRDQGVLGPLLDGIADLYSPQELRQRIIDARVISPGTIMPPYFSTEGLFRVAEAWRSKTIYSAQDVEDIVAYLMTLRSDP